MLAFGIGAYLVSGSAKQALEAEILARLEYFAQSHALALQGELSSLIRRSEDFASDGYLREVCEELALESEAPDAEVVRTELRQHIERNKLGLDAALGGLEAYSLSGDLLVSAGTGPDVVDWAGLMGSGAGSRSWVTSCRSRSERPAGVRFAIVTRISGRKSHQPIGYLVSWVHPASWVRKAMLSTQLAAPGVADDQAELLLVDGAGQSLRVEALLMGQEGPGPDTEPVLAGMGLDLVVGGSRIVESFVENQSPTIIVRSYPLLPSDWKVFIKLDKRQVTQAVGDLQSRFAGIGLIITAAACLLLLFPLRFLTRPLSLLTAAASRIKDGDYGVRVDVESSDEFGQLSHSFNTMASALEGHTARLERTARDLRAGQQELGFERDRMAAVIASMRDGMIVLDAKGDLVVHNDAAQPLLEKIEQLEAELSPRHSCEAKEDAGKDCVACLFAPESPPRSCVVETERGVFEVHATNLRSGPGGDAGRVLVSRDLTDRVAQDEQQIHQERLAVLGEVAAVMAHELNNPLAAMSMYNQMNASLSSDSPELLENTEVIQRNIEACKVTIRELLDYSTGATPRMVCSEIHDVLADTMAFLGPLAKRAEVEMELDRSDQDAFVLGDEVQIRQVFINLIVNALQALGDGPGTIQLATIVTPDQVVVEIADNGPGIPNEARESVFKPFFTTKRRGEGTGLGLPTSRRIAEMHGGGVELLSTGSQGTTFRVRLRSSQTPTE